MFVQIIPLGPKMPHPRGHMFYIGLCRENHEKIILSETTRPRALLFGMKHHLVNLYQVCSNYIPGAKNCPDPRVTCFIYLYWEKHEKILSETIWPKSLDIWYEASPSGPLPSLFQLCPRGQKWLLPWVTCFT